MADNQKKDGEDGIHIDLGLGLGGLFKGLTDLAGQLSNLAEQAEAATSKEGTINFKGLGDRAQGVYGFSIRTASGGGTRVEPFGNIRRTDDGPEVAAVREPLVDVFHENEELLLVAELPGVSAEEIGVAVEGDILQLTTTGERKYAKEVLLERAIDLSGKQQTYTNGILEIRLPYAEA